MPDDEKPAARVAVEIGLDRAFETDPEGFARALAAARRFADTRRARPAPSPADEPAHVYAAPGHD